MEKIRTVRSRAEEEWMKPYCMTTIETWEGRIMLPVGWVVFKGRRHQPSQEPVMAYYVESIGIL